jgi:hypothetical protein
VAGSTNGLGATACAAADGRYAGWTAPVAGGTLGDVRRVGKSVASALFLLLVLAGVAGAERHLTPLVVGWEQFFRLEWEAGAHRGRPVVWGYITNEWGMTAANVRLLVDGLDAAGQVQSQTVGWLGSQLTPGMRAYFEVPVKQPAPAYRVSVFAFDFVQTNGHRRRF